MNRLGSLMTLALGISSATAALDQLPNYTINDHDQLAQRNQDYARLTAHFPNSAELRNILREHRKEVEAKRNFTFFYQGRLWNMFNIQTYKQMSLDQIIGTLPLLYNCNEDSTWALAQFVDSRWMNVMIFNIVVETSQKIP